MMTGIYPIDESPLTGSSPSEEKDAISSEENSSLPIMISITL